MPCVWLSWVYVMGLLAFLWPPSRIIRCSGYQATECRATQEQRVLGRPGKDGACLLESLNQGLWLCGDTEPPAIEADAFRDQLGSTSPRPGTDGMTAHPESLWIWLDAIPIWRIQSPLHPQDHSDLGPGEEVSPVHVSGVKISTWLRGTGPRHSGFWMVTFVFQNAKPLRRKKYTL